MIQMENDSKGFTVKETLKEKRNLSVPSQFSVAKAQCFFSLSVNVHLSECTNIKCQLSFDIFCSHITHSTHVTELFYFLFNAVCSCYYFEMSLILFSKPTMM